MPKPKPEIPPLKLFKSKDGLSFLTTTSRDGYDLASAHLGEVIKGQQANIAKVREMPNVDLSRELHAMMLYRQPFEQAVMGWLNLSVSVMQVRKGDVLGVVTMKGN